jgi:hypothetical protein
MKFEIEGTHLTAILSCTEDNKKLLKKVAPLLKSQDLLYRTNIDFEVADYLRISRYNDELTTVDEIHAWCKQVKDCIAAMLAEIERFHILHKTIKGD